MGAHIFDAVCQALGNDPGTVLSVRMNPHLVVVTAIAPAGHLCTVTCAPSDAGPCAPPTGDGTPSRDAGSGSSGAAVRTGPT